MHKIILYISALADGFITDKNGEFEWLSHPEKDIWLLGGTKFIQNFA